MIPLSCIRVLCYKKETKADGGVPAEPFERGESPV